MATGFKYTASEAFQMAKDYYPHSWKSEIDKCREILFRLKRIYRLDLVPAYQKYLNSGCRPESSIMMLAAVYWIQEEERLEKATVIEQIRELEALQLQYGAQYQANETSNNSDIDKRMLRQFYLEKQEELQKNIDGLIQSIDVECAEVLVIQTSIFDSLKGNQ